MPMSDAFKQRLFKALPEIAEHYGTPFHIYDEAGIRETGDHLKQVFSGIDGFREYFAVKALPNKQILKLMKEMNFGYDCSSIPELIMSRELERRARTSCSRPTTPARRNSPSPSRTAAASSIWMTSP